MNDKQMLLDRYYQTFINLKRTRDFFIGLADYIDYADLVPDFDKLTTELSKQGQPLIDRANELEAKAIARFDEVKTDIESYVATHHLDDERIKKAFEEYDGFRQGKATSSSGMPNALHHCLYPILEIMRDMTEHRDFFSKYVTYFDRDNMLVRSYLDLPELNEYNEARAAIRTGTTTTLWGELNEIAQLYQIIKRGQELWQKAKDTYNADPSSGNYMNVFNFGLLSGELPRMTMTRSWSARRMPNTSSIWSWKSTRRQITNTT